MKRCKMLAVAGGLALGGCPGFGQELEAESGWEAMPDRGALVMATSAGQGVPLSQLAWHGWTAPRWGDVEQRGMGRKLAVHGEVRLAGWQAWGQVTGALGLSARPRPGQHLECRTSVDVERWPQVRRTAVRGGVDALWQQGTEAGVLGVQVSWWVGSAERASPWSQPANPPTSWACWWVPKRPAERVPLPTLGWASGGRWWLAWSPANPTQVPRTLFPTGWGRWEVRVDGPSWAVSLAWSVPISSAPRLPEAPASPRVIRWARPHPPSSPREAPSAASAGMRTSQHAAASMWSWFVAWSRSKAAP